MFADLKRSLAGPPREPPYGDEPPSGEVRDVCGNAEHTKDEGPTPALPSASEA